MELIQMTAGDIFNAVLFMQQIYILYDSITALRCFLRAGAGFWPVQWAKLGSCIHLRNAFPGEPDKTDRELDNSGGQLVGSSRPLIPLGLVQVETQE